MGGKLPSLKKWIKFEWRSEVGDDSVRVRSLTDIKSVLLIVHSVLLRCF